MARLSRLTAPDLPLHVVVRGNNRNAIFRSEGDRVFLHRCLVEAARRFGVSVHGYVFMTNHLHLLASGEAKDSIGKTLQNVGRRYVAYFNFLYGRTGTLWEGRYRSAPIEGQRYLLTCQRYIELNPVRARIVERPCDFMWSSHRFYTEGAADDLVTPHAVFEALGADIAERRRNYKGLFSLPIEEAVLIAIRNTVNKGWALGGAEFCRRLELMSGRRTEPRTRRGRPSRSTNVERAGTEFAPVVDAPSTIELAGMESDPIN